MIPSTVHAIIQREIAAVRRSVEAYPDDESLWAERAGLPNTGGNLVLHLVGNLQHFLGAVIGETGYLRDRDSEFSRRGISRATLLAEIDTTVIAVDRAFARLDDSADLSMPYPLQIGNRDVAAGDFLIHLASHLAYHLGQLDYHRRVVTGDGKGVGALGVAELPGRGRG